MESQSFDGVSGNRWLMGHSVVPLCIGRFDRDLPSKSGPGKEHERGSGENQDQRGAPTQ